MSSLTKDDVQKLAKLARLELSAAEIEKYQKEFSEILSYVEQLSSVNTEGVRPTYQVTGLHTVTRPDEELDYGTTQEDLLNNVPSTKDAQIKVKRMLS